MIKYENSLIKLKKEKNKLETNNFVFSIGKLLLCYSVIKLSFLLKALRSKLGYVIPLITVIVFSMITFGECFNESVKNNEKIEKLKKKIIKLEYEENIRKWNRYD